MNTHQCGKLFGVQAEPLAVFFVTKQGVECGFLGPHVLTSVLKSFEAGFVDVFNRVKTGKLQMGRDTTLTMRDGAAGLGRISPRVPRTLVTRLRQLERQIVTGKLRVSARRSGK